MRKNGYSQFINYAKRWFQTVDLVADLKIIAEDYTGVSAKYIDISNILHILSEIVGDEFRSTAVSFEQWLKDINPTYSYQIGYWTKQTPFTMLGGMTPTQRNELPEYSLDMAVLYSYLAQIRWKTKEELENKFGYIDEPNYNLLPQPILER